MDNESLIGLKILEENFHLLQGFYADNINLVMKATKSNILYCKHIFGLFANASGLKCNWENPIAVFISPRPMSDELRELN